MRQHRSVGRQPRAPNKEKTLPKRNHTSSAPGPEEFDEPHQGDHASDLGKHQTVGSLEEPEVEIALLTYGLASELAKVIPDFQRSVRRGQVQTLADDMLGGRWQLQNDAIVVGVDATTGKPLMLTNGQHRVLARLEVDKRTNGPGRRTGYPVLLMKRKGLGTEEARASYLVTDTGAKRRFSDYLKAEGVSNYVPVGATVAICQTISDDPQRRFVRRTSKQPHSVLAEWWRDCDQELLGRAVRYGNSVRKLVPPLTAPHVAAIVYYSGLLMDDGERLATEFFDKVADKRMDAGEDDPTRILRRRLRKWDSTTGVKPQVSTVWNLTLRAFHHDLADSRISHLKWSPKATPLPVVPPDYVEDDLDDAA